MAKISPTIEQNPMNVIVISDITFENKSIERSGILSTKLIDMEERNTNHSKLILSINSYAPHHVILVHNELVLITAVCLAGPSFTCFPLSHSLPLLISKD
ncbi:hypothetical protein WUBG_04688 [Wuchereria bancrofti]|uniref:Uncharacterized protein n=1 Tax=Wuchereria bancrofti TaxID=6293 RepID=J9BB80_WUCBA|nr:hypothetical protein WUBG_04688 [Wuchereria bancrofti]VDM07672.1 unnamed protein product [Wuchereria bancrofti]